MRLLPVLACCVALPAAAHEFWIEPRDYTLDVDARVMANLVNGEDFDGIRLSYLPQRVVRFELLHADAVQPLDPRIGDVPGLQADPQGDGLHVYGYQSTTSTLTYDDWASFQRFADHKDFLDIEARHRARGLPDADFREVYARFAKTLVAVGDGAGSDRPMGYETEIVALENPYTDDTLDDGVSVQVFYQDLPRMDAQVELFEKAPDGTVTVTYHRTDSNGIADLPVTPGHSYLVDAVVLREPAPDLAASSDAVWETLWASLTFAVPDS